MVTLALLFRPSTTPLVVEDELTVLAQRAGDLLHGLDAGTHGLPAPFVEELVGPGRRVVIPNLLESFLEKVSPDGLEVVAEEVAEPEALLAVEVVLAY